jgi:hypothetical protein
MEEVYAIKKVMTKPNGVKTFVLMTNGSSEILELDSYSMATKFVDVLNENSDSGWVYELVKIKS